MSAHYTKPGLPELPFAMFDEFGTSCDDRTSDYGRDCYNAGRADHIAEVGPMAPLTDEQAREIALRFRQMNRIELALAVIRATENAHGIASPKEAK